MIQTQKVTDFVGQYRLKIYSRRRYCLISAELVRWIENDISICNLPGKSDRSSEPIQNRTTIRGIDRSECQDAGSQSKCCPFGGGQVCDDNVIPIVCMLCGSGGTFGKDNVCCRE